MREVTFVKYTSYGNNFVIIDETQTSMLTESEKTKFAYPATSMNYGVGSDNLLVIQPCTSETLANINDANHYWNELPEAETADFIFRIFEPSGIEAFCCANGLMCVANYLNCHYGIESAKVMTEIPTATPKVISIGDHSEQGISWVNLGYPRRIPAEIADASLASSLDDTIDIIEGIEISFRKYDLAPFSDEVSLKLSGYLVFTGEPHLVIFVDIGFSIKELPKLMFIASCQNSSELEAPEKRIAFGSWLVHHIGTTINKKYNQSFPVGININFVCINTNTGPLEYRCFERGIYKETLSCGTGALAVAFVSQRLNFQKSDRIILWPHRSRWYDPEAQILVMKTSSGWMLSGDPELLFKGKYMINKLSFEKNTSLEPENRIADNSLKPNEGFSYNTSFYLQ